MLNSPHIHKTLATFLKNKGLISDELLKELASTNELTPDGFYKYLVDHELINLRQFKIEIAKLLKLPYIDLDAIEVNKLDKNFFDPNHCKEKLYIPLLDKHNTIYIAVANPIDSQDLLRELRIKYNKNFSIIVADPNKILTKIEELITFKTSVAKDDDSMDKFDNTELDVDEEESQSKDDIIGGDKDSDEAPIIRFINGTIIDAVQKGASDIHFEPYEKNFRIRYRIDGILMETFNTTKNIGPKVVSRLKIMSSLDIAEKRIPQDGKFKISISKDKAIDFRVSTCPINFGEKIVLRIIDSSSTQIPIEALGFAEHQKEIYLNAIYQSQGMVLVTGPTGSGKTVTLYTGINVLNKPEKNISTAEDPVELAVKGINQVNVNNKQGLTFSAALKSFLRQDPDIIMVGEIRDIETGSIAIKASQTGHLVLSTLHTNSAPETLNRLVDMGLPRYNIATSVTLIIAQRLSRKLCPKCKLEDSETKFDIIIDDSRMTDGIAKEFGKTIDELKKSTIYKANPRGCPKCFKGYKGRLGLYEVMPITRNIARMILEDKNTIDIANQAQSDFVSNIRQSALIRTAEGLLSMDEVYRVS